MDSEPESEKVPEYLKILYKVVLIIVIIFTILIIITYIMDKYFRRTTSDPNDKLQLYPYYFNIYFCINILLYILVRLIPVNLTIEPSKIYENDSDKSFMCHFQALSACLLELILLFLMTNYSIVNYLSVFKSDFYKNNIKKIYLTLTFGGLILSIIFAIIFYLQGVDATKDILCSIHTRRDIKIIAECIITVVLMFINLFCLISIIINLVNLAKRYKNENIEKFQKSVDFIKRFILEAIFIFLTFGYTFLAVLKVFPKGSYKDVIYIIFCQLVEIAFTINESLYKAFIRMITCNKYYKLEQKVEKWSEYDDDLED